MPAGNPRGAKTRRLARGSSGGLGHSLGCGHRTTTGAANLDLWPLSAGCRSEIIAGRLGGPPAGATERPTTHEEPTPTRPYPITPSARPAGRGRARRHAAARVRRGAGHDPRRRVLGLDARHRRLDARRTRSATRASPSAAGTRTSALAGGRDARRLGQQQLQHRPAPGGAEPRLRGRGQVRHRRVTTGFQQQGIIVEQDSNDLVRAEVHHDGGGSRLFVATIARRHLRGHAPTRPCRAARPLYLRVKRTGNTWRVRYSQRRLDVDDDRRLHLQPDRATRRPARRQQRQPRAGLHGADRLLQGGPARHDRAGDQRRLRDAAHDRRDDHVDDERVGDLRGRLRPDDRVRQRQGRQRRARHEPQRRSSTASPAARPTTSRSARRTPPTTPRPRTDRDAHDRGLPDDGAVRRVQRRRRST